MGKRDHRDKRVAPGDDAIRELATIGPEFTGMRRLGQVLDALAAVSLRYDLRAIDEPAKRRDRMLFVAMVARVLHDIVREAAGGDRDRGMIALRRLERFVRWVQEREAADGNGTGGAHRPSDAVRLSALVLANLQQAVWGAPPSPTDYR